MTARKGRSCLLLPCWLALSAAQAACLPDEAADGTPLHLQMTGPEVLEHWPADPGEEARQALRAERARHDAADPAVVLTLAQRICALEQALAGQGSPAEVDRAAAAVSAITALGDAGGQAITAPVVRAAPVGSPAPGEVAAPAPGSPDRMRRPDAVVARRAPPPVATGWELSPAVWLAGIGGACALLWAGWQRRKAA